MKYKIVSDDTKQDLVVNVEEHIKQGWIPQGGFCFCPNALFPYAQAMIKHD